MDARQETIDYYKGKGRSISQDMVWHAKNPGGVVIWTHRLVVMARPVSLDTNPTHIIEPEWVTREPYDAWYIHIIAGSMAALLPHIHEIKKYPSIAFQRNGRKRIHIMKTSDFLKRFIGRDYEKITN